MSREQESHFGEMRRNQHIMDVCDVLKTSAVDFICGITSGELHSKK